MSSSRTKVLKTLLDALGFLTIASIMVLVYTVARHTEPDYKAEHIERCDLAWMLATTPADTMVLDGIFECDPPKDTVIAWWRSDMLNQRAEERIQRIGRNPMQIRPAKEDTNGR